MIWIASDRPVAEALQRLRAKRKTKLLSLAKQMKGGEGADENVISSGHGEGDRQK
ncbi:MAG: hypothetical protein HYY28_17140 [Betaproteobacteria bacterium]|nr:hypothetical protein [Betaproteobacteria bacterium]